jgi:Flp pilus assembly protein TadG
MLISDIASLRTFGADRRGNVAMIFAFAVAPLFGLAGGAVDLQMMSRDRAELQGVYDAAALAGVKAGALGETVARLAALQHIEAHLSTRLKAYPYEISVSNGGATVRVATNGAKMDTVFLGIIGMKTLNVVVRTTATATTVTTVTSKKPITAQLDPEAGDYNRMYVYCYDHQRRNQADNGRSQMTAIADNAGTTYNFNMPVCKEKESISYRLYNVRNARTKPWLWDTAKPGTLVKNNPADPWADNFAYNYYSDTENQSGVPAPKFENNVPILETIVCASLSECRPTTQGGIIPVGTNRKPETAKMACAPGRYIYFGWEDRPPGYGWSDSDYDDIRVIVECPSTNSTSTRVVRLTE